MGRKKKIKLVSSITFWYYKSSTNVFLFVSLFYLFAFPKCRLSWFCSLPSMKVRRFALLTPLICIIFTTVIITIWCIFGHFLHIFHFLHLFDNWSLLMKRQFPVIRCFRCSDYIDSIMNWAMIKRMIILYLFLIHIF